MKLKGDETMNKYQVALNALYDEDEMYKLAKGFSFDDDYTSEYDYEKAKEYCKNKIQELINNPPLKIEDLKEGMWVWDDKEKWYRKIVILFDPCQEHPKGSFKSWADSCETSLDFVEFEENRFYRREVTDEKIQ
ncbi:hypothetical protein MKC43_09995 [[Clostridium] innocuum]|nr:hypothetical protein [[Clostridium] innocuum]